MKGIESSKTRLRHKVFVEVARMAYEKTDTKEVDKLPYKIITGEDAEFRDNVFVERAIVGERIRAAMGLSVRSADEYGSVADNIEASAIGERYYEAPLINVIKFACNSCPEKKVIVSNLCQGCLEHPCKEVCPMHAIEMVQGHSYIDQEKCIKCGKCVEACQYHAIVKMERPCMKACGMGAIHSDEKGRADIDYMKCVSCGQCLVSCPFGAIVDKGQIYQAITAMMDAKIPVYAIVAPAIAGQFKGLQDEKLVAAFKELGFTDVKEVAVGADLCTVEEAQDFIKEVPNELPFMATSCCPAWSMMARKMFPEQAKCISMALTPMVLTARLIKEKEPNCKIVFIGPCAAKKLEASRRTIRSYVDFVLTYEEVAGMFEARGVNFDFLPENAGELKEASADGRGFAAAGGVAAAVVKAAKRINPDIEIKTMSADGLQNCRQMLQLAKAGKYNGYLLEGMACPGGCLSGAGTIAALKNSSLALKNMQKEAEFEESYDTQYKDSISKLEKLDLPLEY